MDLLILDTIPLTGDSFRP